MQGVFLYLIIYILQNSLYSLKHTLALDEIEECLDHGVKPLYLVEVLSPDVCSSEHTVSHLLSVFGSLQVIEQLHNLLRVVGDNLHTVLTLATLVVGDDGCKTEDESLRQLALALEVCLHSWQVACAEFRE